jgi:hypothetical protein
MYTNQSCAYFGGFSSATHLYFPEENFLPSLLSRKQSQLYEDDEFMPYCDLEFPFTAAACVDYKVLIEAKKTELNTFPCFETELADIDFFLNPPYKYYLEEETTVHAEHSLEQA